VLPQAAHPPHVLLPEGRGAGSEKEALKKAGVKRWNAATPKAPTPQARAVAELADRGIGKDRLMSV
jgi:hypothetical protein